MKYNFENAGKRSELYTNIRRYFLEKNYLETDTPTLSPDLIPEPTIDNFGTTFINEFKGSREMYLIPSPEVFMKRLIAAGSGSVFQISKCFRNCEQIGEIHNPEFSMLEYYTVGFDEMDSASLTEDFLKKTAIRGCQQSVLAPWLKMSVREAMIKYADTDIEKLQRAAGLREHALSKGFHIPGPESWEDTFNRIFCTLVEPSLPVDRPVMLYDYPRQIKCLAEAKGFYRRRWELYINGIEVANCYKEETDSSRVQQYYEEEYSRLVQERSDNGKVIPDIDSDYYKVFETFPPCSGVAIGLDRLLMAQIGSRDIRDVLLFAF